MGPKGRALGGRLRWDDPGWIGAAQRPLLVQDYFTIQSGAGECTEPGSIFHPGFALGFRLGEPPLELSSRRRSNTFSWYRIFQPSKGFANVMPRSRVGLHPYPTPG